MDTEESRERLRTAFVEQLDDLRERAGFASKAALARAAWPRMTESGGRSKLSRIYAVGWIGRPPVALELARALRVDVRELFAGCGR